MAGERGPVVRLRDGAEMPLLGVGTMDFKAAPGVVRDAVRAALRAGFRHFDCAAVYANQREVGDALRAELADGSVIRTRDDVFVTSKLAPTDMAPDEVTPAVRRMLEELQIERLDLVLLHFPAPLERVGDDTRPRYGGFGAVDSYRALEKVRAAGLTRSIGVSNFNVQLLNELLCVAGAAPPAVNQIERHPYLVQRELVEFCRHNDVAVVAYSPLGTPGTGLAPALDDGGGGEAPPLLRHRTVERVAERHNITPAQALIAWSLSGGVGCVPKSVSERRLAENWAARDVKLAPEDIDALDALDRRLRYFHQRWTGISVFA